MCRSERSTQDLHPQQLAGVHWQSSSAFCSENPVPLRNSGPDSRHRHLLVKHVATQRQMAVRMWHLPQTKLGPALPRKRQPRRHRANEVTISLSPFHSL